MQYCVERILTTYPSFLTLKEVCSKIIPSFFVDKASCTRQFESELSLHSLASLFPIKEGSTSLTNPLSCPKKENVTALRCSESLRYKVGGASKPSPWLCGMGPPGVRWGIGWVLPCSKAWWQRMVIELGLSSGYLMAGFLFPAKFIAERIFGWSCKPNEWAQR